MVLESPGAEKIAGIGNALINSPLLSKIEKIHVNMLEDSDLELIINDLSNKNNLLNLSNQGLKMVNYSTKHGDQFWENKYFNVTK